MKERFKVIPAVFVAVLKDDEVLLQLRKNTGFNDGHYDLPSGHVEDGESIKAAALRELREETGLEAKEESLRLFHICQSFVTPDRPFLYHFFETKEWSGEPAIGVPEKTDDIGFFDIKKLPDTVPYVKTALGEIASKEISFSIDR